VQLQVEEDRQPDMGDLVNAVVAVRAEELEPELEPADVRLDPLGQRFGGIELRDIEGQVKGIAHRHSDFNGPGLSEGCSGAGSGGGATGVTAAVRAALSSELIRRRAA